MLLSPLEDKLPLDERNSVKTEAELEEMIESQLHRLELLYKNTMLHACIWAIGATMVFLVSSNSWYFWVPTGIAMLMLGVFIIVALLRKKLHSELAEKWST